MLLSLLQQCLFTLGCNSVTAYAGSLNAEDYQMHIHHTFSVSILHDLLPVFHEQWVEVTLLDLMV